MIGATYRPAMDPAADRSELTVTRRVFSAWSIDIPSWFMETFVHGDGYWHAFDLDRSVSLTSLTLTDKGIAVRADAIAQQLMDLDGEAVNAFPPGLTGRAVIADAAPSARASRMLSGILVIEGRLLIATITSDDLEWALSTWLSIRTQSLPLPGQDRRRTRMRRRSN
jgi:hypothetical protein